MYTPYNAALIPVTEYESETPIDGDFTHYINQVKKSGILGIALSTGIYWASHVTVTEAAVEGTTAAHTVQLTETTLTIIDGEA